MEIDTIIGIHTLIQRNESRYLANKIGEEMVIMDMETGDFITMNAVGAEIWELSEQPVTVESLVEKMLTVYDLSANQCIDDTIGFLQKSTQQKLFSIHNSIAA